MSDLISRKALLAKVIEANPMGGIIGGKFIEDLIKSEDCAYDVDKVVEQLKSEMASNPYMSVDVNVGYGAGMRQAIKIVRGGGMDE